MIVLNFNQLFNDFAQRNLVFTFKITLSECSTENERNLCVTITAEGEKLKEKAINVLGKIKECIPFDKADMKQPYRILHKLLGTLVEE